MLAAEGVRLQPKRAEEFHTVKTHSFAMPFDLLSFADTSPAAARCVPRSLTTEHMLPLRPGHFDKGVNIDTIMKVFSGFMYRVFNLSFVMDMPMSM